MKKKIKFVTSNDGKFEEVAQWLHELDPTIELEKLTLDVPEIQSLDIEEVALQKADVAWHVVQEPLLIDDGGIYLEQFNNFPGPLTKYVHQGLGFDGFWSLAKQDPRVYFLNVLVYRDSRGYQLFSGKCSGVVIEPSKELIEGHNQLPFTKLLVPEGATRSLAELRGTDEEKKYHHRYHSLRKLTDWLKAKEKFEASNTTISGIS